MPQLHFFLYFWFFILMCFVWLWYFICVALHALPQFTFSRRENLDLTWKLTSAKMSHSAIILERKGSRQVFFWSVQCWNWAYFLLLNGGVTPLIPQLWTLYIEIRTEFKNKSLPQKNSDRPEYGKVIHLKQTVLDHKSGVLPPELYLY